MQDTTSILLCIPESFWGKSNFELCTPVTTIKNPKVRAADTQEIKLGGVFDLGEQVYVSFLLRALHLATTVHRLIIKFHVKLRQFCRNLFGFSWDNFSCYVNLYVILNLRCRFSSYFLSSFVLCVQYYQCDPQDFTGMLL